MHSPPITTRRGCVRSRQRVALHYRSIGQDIGRKKLDLRTSLSQIMSAVATGKAPDGANWAEVQAPDEEAKVTAESRRKVSVCVHVCVRVVLCATSWCGGSGCDVRANAIVSVLSSRNA